MLEAREAEGRRRPVRAASALARRSRAASDISSPTRAACRSRRRLAPPISRIATARPSCLRRYAPVFPGCAACSPMALMRVRNSRPRLTARGGWRIEDVKCSDTVRGFKPSPRRRVVERTWLGCAVPGVRTRISRRPSPRRRHGSSSDTRNSSSEEWQEHKSKTYSGTGSKILEHRLHRVEFGVIGRSFQQHEIGGRRRGRGFWRHPAQPGATTPILPGATTPILPGATAAPMASGCAFIAAVSARSDTGPTALPRAPHAAPNKSR